MSNPDIPHERGDDDLTPVERKLKEQREERDRELRARKRQHDDEEKVANLVSRHVPHPTGFIHAKAHLIKTGTYRVNLWCERENEVGAAKEHFVGDSHFVQIVPDDYSDFRDLTVKSRRR